QSFVQVKGTKNLDASAMLMPMMRFISPVDPMWLSTMKAIEKRLVEDTLVYRYEAERTHIDGLPGGEGSFTACSFWYVECLARAGELENAQLLFEIWDTPIILGSTRSKLVQAGNISATSHRRSRIWR